MKRPPFASNTMISRVLKLLSTLAAIKLALILVVAVGIMPMDGMLPEAVAQQSSGAPATNDGAAKQANGPAKNQAGGAVAGQEDGQANGSAKAQSAANANKPLDWQALRRKEEELNRREQALNELEKGLDGRLKQLESMEKNVKKMLETADVKKNERLRHLVEVYANMKAKQAAAALERLDQEIAVHILSGMRGRQAGEIMSQMNSDKTAILSEALTRMQMPFEE